MRRSIGRRQRPRNYAAPRDLAGGLTERECRERCDEALCDDWFWKERLPCWNWGYGG